MGGRERGERGEGMGGRERGGDGMGGREGEGRGWEGGKGRERGGDGMGGRERGGRGRDRANLEGSGLLVVLDEIVLVQHGGGRVYEVGSPLLQEGIPLHLLVGHPIQPRGPQHPDVQVGVA